MAPGGATVVAWSDVVAGEPVMRAAIREPGGGFAGATLELATTEVQYSYSVAISPRGTALIAWAQKDDAGKWRVAAAVRPAGGAWGQPQILSGPGTSPPEPAVAIGGNEDAWIIWHRTALSNELVEGIRRSPAGAAARGAAPARGDRDGRQRPVGQGPRPAPDQGPRAG